MKKISLKLFSFASAAALIVAGSGCAKISEFGDTNVNPNGASSPITAALLTNIESQLGGIAYNIRGAIYTQQISETQYTDVSLYQLPQLSSSGTYAGPMMDAQVIINRNSDPATAGVVSVSGSNANQIAVAKIVKAYMMWTLTDKWGDLPYSEALQGASNKSPKYDTQEDIYKAIFKDCRDAIAGFDVGQWMQGDIVYGGDPAKWKKLANSIRMIAALRMSKRYPASTDYPALEFAAAFSNPAGYISSNADNFTLNFPGGNYPNTCGVYIMDVLIMPRARP
ncbi:MAG: SusD/RagB family nutrient-binding outer membrane lipoprotein [Chitinophagaceae bacterium]|nr:SusD/RagB family nutrient-binding outer membrane lipoprotein [Chitinophagaceae bacterium]